MSDPLKPEARILLFSQKTAAEVHKLAMAEGITSAVDLMCIFGVMHAMAAHWAVNEACIYESKEAAMAEQTKLVAGMYDSFKLKSRRLDA